MMRKIVFLLALILTGSLNTFAQNVTFKASVPEAVVVGQQFRLSYSLNSDDGKELRVPELPQGLDLLAGPYSSTSSYTEFVNGRVSTEVSVVYTYTLIAREEGTFDIPSATIKVKNSEYKSNALKIRVLPNDRPSQQGSSGGSQQQGSDGGSSSQNVNSDDIFVRMHVSKNSVYENEGFLVTFKLYFAIDVAGAQNAKFPSFDGFVVHDIELPQDVQPSLENYNGRNYRTAVLKQVVLFPQRSGKIIIEKGTYDFVVRVRTQQRISFSNPFLYTEVVKSLATPAATIDVKSLPSGKPASFSGAVGDYKMTSSISHDNMKSNESVTVKVNISGTGNIKLISNPAIVFPNDFEVYDPKVDVNIKVNAGGVSGSKSIEYLAIPRYAGDFTIPSAEFSYFDTKSGSYKTLKTDEFKLHVEKGAGGEGGSPQIYSNASNKESIKFLGKDIRYIKTEGVSFDKKGNYFFGTITYTLLYIIPAILFIIFFIIYRKQAKENANIALVRTKKANKVASKRLKMAGKYLKENKKEEFYDETLRALWGYLSDKLNIPVSSLTKDNVETELEKYGVNEGLSKVFMDILNTCEFARFAPAQDAHEMDKVYESTVQAIDKMENTIKK